VGWVPARFVKRGAGMHCPSLNIFGTFFPAWMLCALIGIVGAAVAFKIISARHVEVGPPLLVYPSIVLAITSLTWLGFYGH
jgi:hypothetical protein